MYCDSSLGDNLLTVVSHHRHLPTRGNKGKPCASFTMKRIPKISGAAAGAAARNNNV